MLDLSLLENSCIWPRDSGQPTRIALIHTSLSRALRRRGDPAYKFASHFPGLGLLNLAQSLRVDQAVGRIEPLLEVAYFDEESYLGEDDFFSAVLTWASAVPRSIIAASAYTWTIDYLESFLARFNPGRFLIVVGGPHVTLAPDLASAHILVRGEGGAAMRHIVNTVLTPAFGIGDEAPGICYQHASHVCLSQPAYDRSLENLPSPAFAYDLLSPSGETPVFETHFKRLLGDRPQIYVCTQSCRARCTFCSTYLIHGKAVARPLDRVRTDLHLLVDHFGYRSLEFHDDDLLQHPEFEGLLDLLEELQVPWFCYARVPPIDERIATRMSRAGCRRVFLGVEALDQATLDYFHKETSVDQNRQAVAALAGAGVGVVAGMIIGAPHHTVESILNSLRAYLELPLLFINVSVLSPDPGTPEYRRAKRRGVFPNGFGGESGMRLIPDYDSFGAGAPAGFPSVCDNVSKEILNDLAQIIEIEFYLRHSQRRRFDGFLDNEAQRYAVGQYYAFLERKADELGWIVDSKDITDRYATWRSRREMRIG
jgi:anaerobic magnesium-protoporphyrin IX monomethyl ester cyclase